MTDYLMRDQAPLSEEQWQRIDETVRATAERNLVGRRIMPLFGPFGPGVQAIPLDSFTGTETGAVDFLGEEEAGLVQATARTYLPLPVIAKDFRLHWRDLETASHLQTPLDVSAAAAAAAFCARTEDDLIFNGRTVNGTNYSGIMNAPGRNQIGMSNWADVGNAFRDVVSATQMLVEDGFFGPYALVVGPRLYASMNRLHENSGVLEIEQVQKITTGGVYQTPVLGDTVAVVVSVGPENMDLAVAQDLATAFLETSRMNHYFRVLEILAPRIKRPESICTIERPTT